MPEEEIRRADTVLRVILAIIFWIVGGIVELALGFLVVFSLLYALATQRAPSESVRRTSNRVIAYLYRIYRFLTYNDLTPPFPFSDLPKAVDAPTWAPRPSESELLGVRSRRNGDDGRPTEVLPGDSGVPRT